jgi:hypothetical protein
MVDRVLLEMTMPPVLGKGAEMEKRNKRASA